VPTICNYDVLITEIIDPLNDDDGRYIEIQANQQCAYGSTVQRPLYLAYYDCGGSFLSPIHIPLQGLTFDENGFIVICASSNGDSLHGQGTCDYTYGGNGPANGDGEDRYVIKEGTFPNGDVIDAFGTPWPPTDCVEEGRCFNGGRVSRKSFIEYPNTGFDIDEWIFNIPINTGDSKIDPGARVDSPNLGFTSSPTPAPTSPTKGSTPAPTSPTKGSTPAPTSAAKGSI